MKRKRALKIASERSRKVARVPGRFRTVRLLLLSIAAISILGAGIIRTASLAQLGQQGIRGAAVKPKRLPNRRNKATRESTSVLSQGRLTPEGTGPVLASVDFNLIGLAVTATPATQTVPKNTPTVVNTSVQAPPGTDPNTIISQLNPNYRVEGDLSGPSFSSPLTLNSAIGQPLQIPALSRAGDHILQNLRVVDTGTSGSPVIAPVTPDSVGITVIDQLLVSQVQVTPLSYNQITQLGINITDDSYKFFNFTLGLSTTSGTVPISIPVAMPDGSIPNAPPVIGRPSVSPNIGTTVPSFTAAPVMLSLEDQNGNGVPLPDFGSSGPAQIPGVVVFPGRVGFLHQFFEAIVIVTNGAPGGTPLVIHDLNATMALPDNGTPNDPTDDPLRIAATQTGGVVTNLAIHGLGPDGQYGTPDDTTTFSPGQSGQATFLLEGLKEGLWNVDFNLQGKLDGLPIGTVTVKGSVSGAVLVRDPTFSVTFMHPSVVRAGQQYDLAMTLNNTGKTDVQGAIAQLAGNSISGAELLPGDDGKRSFATDIPSNQSSTVVWRLRSDTTGAVTASYVKVGDGVQSGLILTTGVGDRNVPLSPDSLILPDEVRFLPPPVVDAARQVLGQAWGVANAPPGALPAGVTAITQSEVVDRAVDVGIAGVRAEFGEPLEVTLGTLVRDWLGEAQDVPDPGFADAIRNTVSGYNWYDTVGAQFGALLNAQPPLTPAHLHQEFANAESPRSQFVSALVTQANGQAAFGASIVDPSGNPVGDQTSLTDRVGNIALGASMRMNTSDPSANPATRVGQMLLVSRPVSGNYTLSITGWQTGSVDISLMIPVSGSNYRQVIFSGVQVTTGGQYRITFAASGSKGLVLESLVNGTWQATGATPAVTAIPEPAATVEGVMQVSPDVLDGGDKYGRLVGILFSKPMAQAQAETNSHYQIGGGTLTGSNAAVQAGLPVTVLNAKLNFGGRMTLIALDTTIGPFIDRNITMTGLTDLRGLGLVSSPFTSPITMTVSPQGNPPGGYLTGHVLLADGTPVVGASVIYWTQPCQSDEAPAPITNRVTDSNGAYEIDYVRNGDCGPVVVSATNPTTGSVKRLSTPVIYNNQHLILDPVFLARGNLQGVITIGGAAAPGAFVRVTPVLDVTGTSTVQADGAGNYTVSDIPVGNVSVFAVGAGSESNATGLAAGNVPGPGQTGVVNVSLQSLAGIVKGSVVHFDQSPSVGSLVVASFVFPGRADLTPVGFSYTDRNGNFSISNLPVGAISLAATDYVT
ncbi:MAG TPA: hypothetical protein VJX67_20850, partial [Blastocatellia bacterium]|nr:hypothetical protein [Blastocatellia bacterium]